MTLTDDYLQGLVDSEPDYQEPAPAIDGDTAAALKDADWHLRHLARIETQLTDVAELYRWELDRLNRWHERQTKRLQLQAQWHRIPLEGLHRSILAADKNRKTIELPHGILKSRTYTKPKLSIDDMEALVNWALENAPELFPPPQRLRIVDIQQTCHVSGTAGGDVFTVINPATGEHVPGVSAAIPAPTFDVSTDLDSEPF